MKMTKIRGINRKKERITYPKNSIFILSAGLIGNFTILSPKPWNDEKTRKKYGKNTEKRRKKCKRKLHM